MAAKYQHVETKKEIIRLLEAGQIELTPEGYKRKLAYFGLTLDMSTEGYLYKYYNTSNEHHYLEATTSALDSSGICAFNTNGIFYQTHVKPKTSLYREFREFRNRYFTVLRSGHILSV